MSNQTLSLLEKTTEIRFFLHILCIGLYLQIANAFVFGDRVPPVAWAEFENLSPVKVLALVVCYFALMGYVFRIAYVFVTFAIRRLNDRISSSNDTRWGDIPGMVHEDDVVHHAYVSKDSELIRQLEAHKIVCRQERKELGDLAYLSFAALILIVFDHYWDHSGLIEIAQACMQHMLTEKLVLPINVLLLLPLFVIIWRDITVDYDRETYLKHGPLYEELKRNKDETRRLR